MGEPTGGVEACFCIPPSHVWLSPLSGKSWGQSWWFCCCCFRKWEKYMFLFQGFCLIVFARQSRIFTAQALSSRAPLSQRLFYVLFIQPFSLKKGKREIYPLKVSFLLNLCLSFVCHVNYVPNNPLSENSAIKLYSPIRCTLAFKVDRFFM